MIKDKNIKDFYPRFSGVEGSSKEEYKRQKPEDNKKRQDVKIIVRKKIPQPLLECVGKFCVLHRNAAGVAQGEDISPFETKILIRDLVGRQLPVAHHLHDLPLGDPQDLGRFSYRHIRTLAHCAVPEVAH